MIGNLLLILIALVYFGVLNITSSPMPGGDRGMGYGILLFVCGVGFILLTGLLTWYLGANNCLDWINVSGGYRNWLIFFGWLAFATSTVACALFKTEWHEGVFPQYLRWFSHAQAAFWLPLLMLVPAFFLLNIEKQAALVPNYIKIPMMVGFLLSILMGIGLLFGWARGTAQQKAANLEYAKDRDEEQQSNFLSTIAEQKPNDPIVNLLALTGRFHDSKVRDSAIAKVKSRPNWEAELIQVMSETEFDTEVYHFIDGNKVEHPELFIEPINRSIRRIAKEIKARIKDSSNLQDWHFEHFSLERLFRAIDEQFLLQGADYRASVLELRSALDTPKPERFQDVKFSITPLVDDWLRKHP